MDRLAELREKRGLTLRELSRMSGVSPDTINQIELGHRKPRPSTLRKLARALDANIQDFFEDEESATRPKAEPSLSDTGEQRRGRYLPWLEFANKFADGWEKKISQKTFDPGEVTEFLETLEALNPVLSRLGLEEKREQPEGYIYSYGPIMGEAIDRIVGLLNPLIEAGIEIEEGSELARLRRRREELAVAQDQAMSG